MGKLREGVRKKEEGGEDCDRSWISPLKNLSSPRGERTLPEGNILSKGRKGERGKKEESRGVAREKTAIIPSLRQGGPERKITRWGGGSPSYSRIVAERLRYLCAAVWRPAKNGKTFQMVGRIGSWNAEGGERVGAKYSRMQGENQTSPTL